MCFSSFWFRQRMGKARTANRGFTLVEVMVAAMLLLFAMAGIVPFFISGLSQASTVRYKSIATNIARERMEEIRQLDYREITSPQALAERFGTKAEQRGITFTVSYAVEETTYDQGLLKKVTITVSWSSPPKVSPASITTLIHQQFLGPRGALLEVLPASADPLGTPFALIAGTIKVRYHIAQADWGLVYANLDQPGMTARDVYMRLAAFADTGESIGLGDPANDYKIDKTYLRYATGTDGKVTDVWFEYNIDSSVIPDGYWELRAVAYNEYNEPGNVWRLRVRVEQNAPVQPTSFFATPGTDNQTVILEWLGGPERDRAYYVLERRKFENGAWSPWTTIGQLDPDSSAYTDQGSAAEMRDPWGDSETQNLYEYQLYAVDICNPGKVGAAASAQVAIPPVVTTTTTLASTTSTVSSTTTSSTTSTAATYWVQIVNQTNKSYSVIVKNASGSTVWYGTVGKRATVTISGLPAGNYQITASSSGRPTLTQSFSLPAQAGTVVMTIL